MGKQFAGSRKVDLNNWDERVKQRLTITYRLGAMVETLQDQIKCSSNQCIPRGTDYSSEDHSVNASIMHYPGTKSVISSQKADGPYKGKMKISY